MNESAATDQQQILLQFVNHTNALREVVMRLVADHDWDADTMDHVGMVLTRYGYIATDPATGLAALTKAGRDLVEGRFTDGSHRA